ncbi:Epl1 protein [Stereum hirsutum FP-91666 SS1]|uniref:Epl1 protein n=1 Tax=Stereum hirsutum (strain FP-91666) TaxID=721885 RepID=UPI00044496F9|nr:Epl1 protein [Stereum hirsutum FP-91666 SS1]EIM82441.1 Epl1 protein [Stereum hirsutum FP-91666 SS1]
MKFGFAFTAVAFLIPSALATAVRYDTTYDNAGQSTDTVACSDGTNGLASRYPTFGSFPKFPFLAASDSIPGWNSPNCGTCFAVTYNGVTVNVLAIDHAGDGINMSLEAMNALTNGQATFLGTVDATVAQVDKSACGL